LKRIALISDTHNFLDPKLFKYVDQCHEIWHAGDIGTIAITDELQKHKPVKAVYGNIDGHDVRAVWPRDLRFNCEGMDVLITHIGGYPGRYSHFIKDIITANPPQLFICGHSHILKVMPDKKLNLLHINPGAAGVHGFHKVKTMVRFTIDSGAVKDLEAIEFGLRA
jgi:putative phosphoesterase